MSKLPNFIERAAHAAGVSWETYLAGLPAAGYSKGDIDLIRRLGAPDADRKVGKRGRDFKWSDELHQRLVREVDEMSPEHGISKACRVLAKQEPWRSLVETAGGKQKPSDTLRERYVRLGFAGITVYFDPRTADHTTGKLGTLLFTIPNKKPGRGGKHRG